MAKKKKQKFTLSKEQEENIIDGQRMLNNGKLLSESLNNPLMKKLFPPEKIPKRLHPLLRNATAKNMILGAFIESVFGPGTKVEVSRSEKEVKIDVRKKKSK